MSSPDEIKNPKTIIDKDTGFKKIRGMSYVLAKQNKDLTPAELAYKRDYRRNVAKRIKMDIVKDPRGRKRLSPRSRKISTLRNNMSYYLLFLMKNHRMLTLEDNTLSEYHKKKFNERLELLYLLVNDPDGANAFLARHNLSEGDEVNTDDSEDDY